MSARGDRLTFSLAEARATVSDLFAPREWIYWADFLPTILLGHAAFAATRLLYDLRLEPLWLRLVLQALTFTVQCLCYYRAVMFVHELVHLPDRSFRAFRIVWNLLCGIPFLVPSFTYYTHIDHHRRTHFGTEHDGEYLPLARMSPWWIAVYLSQCLWVPALALLRFGVLTPLGWFVPAVRRWAHQHASSLVMDPSYLRPAPSPGDLRNIRLQEVGCLVVILAGATIPLVLGRPLIVFVIHAYATAAVLILLNSIRTLASHRYWSDGHEMTFVEQLLDSVTLDSDALWAVLLNPVGLRYHAMHHLFPSLPYHNIRAAHKRLLARLPANSAYHQTVERSLAAVLLDLVRRARQHAAPPLLQIPVEPARPAGSQAAPTRGIARPG